MLKKVFLITLLICCVSNNYAQKKVIKKVLNAKPVEQYIEVEAESFYEQNSTNKRTWYVTTAKKSKRIKPDTDKKHVQGSSNGAYIEVLPETFSNNATAVEGVNFSETPGKVAVLNYKVNFKTTGQFFVWVRGYSTSFQDNSIHVGIDNKWPKSGTGIYFCEGQNNWTWTSAIRDNSDNCDNKNKRAYIMVNRPGQHIIQFSMREDGFEFDKWVLTKKGNKKPY